MSRHISIGDRRIGPGEPTYVIAEMSANHHQKYGEAVRVIEAAQQAGADAIKLQTYTADTMTIDVDSEYFRISGTLWEGRTLHDLYGEAYTPWEWHAGLKAVAKELGLDFFSTPFDATAVDFLEELEVPAYKVASFENTDLPLLRRIGATRKPVILSTGMATLAEIDEAVRTLWDAGASGVALLKCTSAYPASHDQMNLRTIPHLAETFHVPTGLSDHTMGSTAAVTAVALGASLVEKHLTVSRDREGPDSAFSMEPQEFRAMVDAVRMTEAAVGSVRYGVAGEEKESAVFRRSLFVVKDMAEGEPFTAENVRVIRPGHGLAPKHLDDVVGRSAASGIRRGTPLRWSLVR